MDGQESNKKQGINVITRAASILRLLGQETAGLSLGQIAAEVDLPRSTVQRLVAALALEGFITVEGGNAGIKLGPEIRSLAQASSAGIVDRMRPFLKKISEATGETVDLAVLDGSRMRFIDQIVGSQRLRTVSSIGETFPLTTTANGKAALACLDEERANELIAAEIEEHTGGIRNLEELQSEIAAIRNGALARDENEHTEGVSALGFAVMDPGGDIYAISIPVPTSRFERTRAKLLATVKSLRAGPIM